jgi:peptidoglycan/xylan/chitin deacetylase (PgdA/CDA1 family)
VTARGKPIVLCYHAVSPAWNHYLAVPPDRLLRQIETIRWRGYRGATPDEALEGRGRLLHVTFDDAFRNIAPFLPELKRRQIPATVFACSGYAETGAALTLPELEADDGVDVEALATMAWDELRTIAREGVEIGSHTVSHPHLPTLSDVDLARELRASRERIEEKLELPCRFLAYPYGEHDGRVQAAARAAGYEAAFALDGRPGNPYAVPRVDLFRHEGALQTAVKTMPRMRGAAKRLRRIWSPTERGEQRPS